MARLLFAATPAAGHVNPALPLVKALRAAGHEVRFTTGREFERSVTRAGAVFTPVPAEVDWSGMTPDERWPERAALTGLRKLQWDIANYFVAPVAAHVRHIEAMLAEEPADVLVADPPYGAATAVHERGGPPVVHYGITALGLPSRDLPPFGLGLSPMSGPLGRLRDRALTAFVRRTVFAASIGQIDAQRTALGLPPAGRTAMDAGHGVALHLQLCTPGFEYPRTDLPAHVHFVGHPAPLPPSTPFTPPPWWPEVTSGDRPVVVVSQGTIATDPAELLRPALAGLAAEELLVVVVTGGADPSVLGPLPGNARAAAFIPFAELFPHARAVVTNGGYGTIQLALAHGLPMVVAGRTEDKPETAARVAWSGVGLDLRSQTPSASAVRDSVRRVLRDPSFSDRARALRDELADGATPEQRAVALIEKLIR
ncbi:MULTISPECIES: nucleotide disphospho-sugar-binding domain-containing protein [Catenuloplanes]|uniref:UDP:flavonoid glycosyltransferase YjiC (YdhE family) n=1 Tax=Catenuloplanes niger TaxID=587534 RepID=A0AAE3ZL30_9ACTN|nr:nucleotide disphospho-sugar-binding domain-containing protein [Catenuloplanes niger]MDR7320600.1 UDP:flavonoid glycosyltransferase YjiC (YdhE family) [Catenuloplanes niger]